MSTRVKEEISYFRQLAGPFLQDKTALVFGSAYPVSQAIAAGLARLGAHLVLASEGWQNDAGKYGDAVLLETGPRLDAAAAERIVQEALARYGRIDMLINCPGYGSVASLETMNEQMARELYETVVLSTSLVCQKVAPVMQAQKHGRIIMVGNGLAKSGSARRGPHFTAAFAALHALTRNLTTELFASGITVNTVAPFSIAGCESPGGDMPPVHNPLGRSGKPDEAAAPVLFLCSDHACFITGACIDVNGGAYMD